jgi:hypothetical protein
MRVMQPDDHLGHLVPPGRLTFGDLRDRLFETMYARRFLAGHGIPSVPTRYVVAMNTADRAWLDPTTEDRLSRALTEHAESAGWLLVGPLEVEIECDMTVEQGRPRTWAGFRDDDLLVLAGPKAALDVFASRA